jgi:hypothetical protein
MIIEIDAGPLTHCVLVRREARSTPRRERHRHRADHTAVRSAASRSVTTSIRADFPVRAARTVMEPDGPVSAMADSTSDVNSPPEQGRIGERA